MSNKINIGTEIDLQDLLQSRLLIQANSGGGKSVLARVIIEETFGKVPFIVMDIEGEYYTLKEKYGDVLIIGGQHADIPISMKSVKLLPKEIISNRLSVVIDLSDLQMSDRIMYAKYFLETMMDLTKDYWINYLVFIEEAHKLCGEQDKQASATAVKDLMSRGRKRGYCGILLTQRISKLHKDAAAECNNKFIGRTFLDIDLDRAAKELGLSTQTDKNIMRSLKPGKFYAFGTSIEPHQVHEVQINLPKTKVIKAGVNLEIKPKAPTEKIKSMLAKLNDLPAEAEKELKTIQQLQAEVSRLNTELHKTSQSSKNVKSPDESQKFADYKKAWDQEANHRLAEFQALKKDISVKDKVIQQYDILLKKVRGLLDTKFPESVISGAPIVIKIPESVIKTDKSVQPVSKSFTDHNTGFAAKVYGEVKNALPTEKLGKCPFAILEFLASFPQRSWTKVQVGIATNYSPGSGGFNNSLSELTTKGLINRANSKLQINQTADTTQYLGPNFQPKEYSIETFKSKLGKCEREIYEVLLANPESRFSKKQLA